MPIVCSLILATLIIITSYVREKNRNIDVSKSVYGKMSVLERARHTKATLVAKQGAVYLAIFYSTYMFPTISILIVILKQGKMNFGSLLIGLIFLPLDGLFFTLAYKYLLNRKQSDQITIEIKDNEKSSRRLSFSVSDANKNSIASYDIKNDPDYSKMKNHTQRRRSAKVFVSIFDGTDEEKWKLFGVFAGSEDSDDSDQCDNDKYDDKETELDPYFEP